MEQAPKPSAIRPPAQVRIRINRAPTPTTLSSLRPLYQSSPASLRLAAAAACAGCWCGALRPAGLALCALGGQVAWGGRQGERAIAGKGRLNCLYSVVSGMLHCCGLGEEPHGTFGCRVRR
jgi:hypothetical protein